MTTQSLAAQGEIICATCGHHNGTWRSRCENCRTPLAEEAQQTMAMSATQQQSELSQWGISLIALGLLHLWLSNILDPTWGVVLMILGGLNLVFRHKFMFIVNGLALILVGLLNIFAVGLNGWAIFGIFQIRWGLAEMKKFGQVDR